MQSETDLRVQAILDKNRIDDLERFLSKRRCLNVSTQYIGYAFHLIQSAGILVVSVGQAYGEPMWAWVGVGLNTIASVLHVVMSDNKKVSKTVLVDMRNIKSGDYLDESVLDTEDGKSQGAAEEPALSAPRRAHAIKAAPAEITV